AAGSSQAQQGPVQLEGRAGLTVLTVNGEFAVPGRLGQPGVSAAGAGAEPEGGLVRFPGHRNPAAIAAAGILPLAEERSRGREAGVDLLRPVRRDGSPGSGARDGW